MLSRYSLPEPVLCRFFRHGVNDTYQVEAESSTYFLRIYRHGWRTRAEIEAEVDMLLHLRSEGLSVSYPLERTDGTHLTRIGAPEGVRYATLFTNAPGAPVTMNDRNSRVYGELVARIHASLDTVAKDDRRFHLDAHHLVVEPLGSIEPFLQHRRTDLDYLRDCGTQLAKKIEILLPQTSPHYGSCHGDVHGGNVHIGSGGGLTLFDFDCWGYGWRAYDVAVFPWAMALRFGQSRTGRGRTTRRWNAFLRGYERVRELAEAEREAIRIFVPIRHLWLMGLHTRGSAVWGRGWMPDPYFTRGIKFIKNWIAHYKIL